MPRVAGQIDLAKSEAILDAAGEVLAERGLMASMDEIARAAGVSKQTVYNHYGCKADLVRALVERRVESITAPLVQPGAAEHPEETLTGYARGLLQSLTQPRGIQVLRLAMTAASELPDLARAVYEAGPRASRARLADYLARETGDGRLACPDAAEAAEFFGGMVLGSYQTAALLGAPRNLTDGEIEALAREATGRFMRAYAP
jgi:TetR/AcrR family transcriptional regulator, mexJK operon transcriptional repressor